MRAVRYTVTILCNFEIVICSDGIEVEQVRVFNMHARRKGRVYLANYLSRELEVFDCATDRQSVIQA